MKPEWTTVDYNQITNQLTESLEIPEGTIYRDTIVGVSVTLVFVPKEKRK